MISSMDITLPKSKASLWKLKDDNSTNLKSGLPFVFSTPEVEVSTNKIMEEMKSLISDKARMDLSKAAKRAVYRRHALMKSYPYQCRLVKTSESKRTKTSRSSKSLRPEVYSAPPDLEKSTVSSNNQPIIKPPKIVIKSASEKSYSVNDFTAESQNDFRESDFAQPKTAFIEKDSLSIEHSALAFTSRSVLSNNDSSSFLGAYCPDTPAPDYGHKSQSFSARSRISFTDWNWVRERLASRQSVLERPDSCLTFNDFLETLTLNSDEYDTDLEDDAVDDESPCDDHTGVYRYKEICGSKGIVLAKQVVTKLSDENQAFNLSHRSLNKKDAEAIAAALSDNSIIRSVNFSGNHIDDDAAKPLFFMLRKNSYIKKLDMSKNNLMSDKHNYISRLFSENSTLTHVTLSDNKLGDKEALLISEALRNNYSLEYLNLSNNRFTDLAGQSIAAALIDNDFLTSLNLSWNTLGKPTASALGKALKTNASLRSLDLSYNGFGDDGTALFSRSLRHNSTLRLLSLAVNHIGLFGCEKLAAGISGLQKNRKKSKSNLRSLNLSRNPLGKKGLSILLKYMEQSEKLQDLCLDQVVLSSDILSHVKQITTSTNAVVFYEGQDEDDRKSSALRFGAQYLNELLEKQFKPKDFFDSFDPDNTGVTTNQIRIYLEKLYPVPSELEIRRLLFCLDSKRLNVLRYSDIFNSSTEQRVVFKPVKPVPSRVRRKLRT